MNLLITGGMGFLGSHCAERALGAGHSVLVVDDLTTGRHDALHPHADLDIVEGDISDPELIGRLFSEFVPSHVIHAAASYKDPDDWRRDIATNVEGTANLLSASQGVGVRRFVYLQTALCYGAPRERPISLQHPLQPASSYAISKVTGEHYVGLSSLEWVSLRLANIYGPRHYSGPMPAFYKRLKAGEKATVVDTRRDFIEIDDFLDLVDQVLRDGAPTGAFNVSSGEDSSIREIYEMIAEQLGASERADYEIVAPSSDDVETLLLDASETSTAFDWRPRVDLEDGLSRLVDWYEQNGVGETYTHLRIPPQN